MEENIKKYWGQMLTVLTREQSFLVGIYLTFVAFLTKKEQGTCAVQYHQNDIRNLKQLREIFNQVPGYELKRSVNDFEESINWSVIQENNECKAILNKLLFELKIKIMNLDDFEKILEIFMDFTVGTNMGMVTPKCVNELIVKLIGDRQYKTIGEFCCKFSYVGLSVYKQLASFNQDNKISLVKEDSIKLYCDISQIRMYCHGILRPQTVCHNILNSEKNKDIYELVLSDLPKGNNESISSSCVKGMKDNISKLPNYIFSEWGYIYKILERVSETGKAFIIATNGALVRERESVLREQIIEKDWLEAVITLPEGLYTGSYLGFELLIFDKCKNKNHKNKVLFADLSEKSTKYQNRVSIPMAEIEKITSAYLKFEELEEYVIIKTREEIQKSDYSWKPYLHLQLKKIESKWKQNVTLDTVSEIIRGAQISKEEEINLSRNPTHYWLNIRNIINSDIVLDEDTKIRAKSSDWERKFELIEDDIVITSKGTELKICIIPPDFPPTFICGNLTRIRAKKIHPYILYEFLTSEEGRVSLESIQTGTTIKLINNKNLQNLKVPFDEMQWEKGKRLKQIYVNYRNEKKRLKEEFEHKRKEIVDLLKYCREESYE